MEIEKKLGTHIMPLQLTTIVLNVSSTSTHTECEQSSSLSPFDAAKKQGSPIVSENMCMASRNEDSSQFWPGVLWSFHTHHFPGDRTNRNADLLEQRCWMQPRDQTSAIRTIHPNYGPARDELWNTHKCHVCFWEGKNILLSELLLSIPFHLSMCMYAYMSRCLLM